VRVAILHPTWWPEVRRGAERLTHGLASWLAAAGHEVSLLTTHRRANATTRVHGFTVVRSWRPPDRVFQRRAYEDFLGTIVPQVRDLLGGDYDVAHAFHPVSAWSALQAHRRGGPPVVFSTTGIPTRPYLVARRYRMRMNLDAAREAAACSVLSKSAAEPFRRYLLREPEVIPPGIDCADWEVDVGRAERPTIVYAGSLSDPRKRLPLLLDAFSELRRRRPEVVLKLAGRPEPWLRLDLPEGVELLGAEAAADLPREVATAHLSVLPAVEEAFGLVLAESLAAGTPVVAARSGAGPEIVSADVGRLFDPDDRDSLVAALGQGLDMEAGSAGACRARARQWDWSTVGPRYEDLERGALAGA
jgi:glycosyltransferase involved in cell wall biosynthesis